MTRVNIGLWLGKRPSLGGALGITPRSVSSLRSAVDFKLACMEATIQRTMDGKQPNRSLNRSANRVRDL